MKTSEVISKLDIPRHKLYYLEQKGYIHPKRIPMGDLESREFSEQDFERVKIIWKYLQRGYKHRAALQMASEELDAVNNGEMSLDFGPMTKSG